MQFAPAVLSVDFSIESHHVRLIPLSTSAHDVDFPLCSVAFNHTAMKWKELQLECCRCIQ